MTSSEQSTVATVASKGRIARFVADRTDPNKNPNPEEDMRVAFFLTRDQYPSFRDLFECGVSTEELHLEICFLSHVLKHDTIRVPIDGRNVCYRLCFS